MFTLFVRQKNVLIIISLIALIMLSMGAKTHVIANGQAQGEDGRVIPENLPKITPENAAQLTPIAKLGRGTPQNMRWTADGSRLMVIGFANLWIYEADDFGEPIQQLDMSGDFRRAIDADINADGQLAIVSEYDKARLWDMNGEREPLLLTEVRDPAIAFSPDGRAAYSTATFGIHLRDIDSGDITAFQGHTAYVRSLAFSPDGLLMATASEDGTARLWNTQNGEEIQQFSLDESALVSVAFSPDGNLVAVSAGRTLEGGYNPSAMPEYPVGVFDLVSQAEILRGTTTITPNQLSFSADGGRLTVSGTPSTSSPSVDGRILPLRALIFDVAAGTSMEAPIEDSVRQFRFSPRGDWIAMIGDDGPQILSAGDYSVQSTLPYFGFVQFVDFDAEANRMMWQAGYSTQVVDLATGLVHAELGGLIGRQFANDGTLIGLSQNDHIQWWDFETQSVVREIDTSGDSVGVIVFSENESQLLYNTGEGQIKLWDVGTQTLIFEALLEAPLFGEMRFSEDGQLVIHNAYNRIRIWDAETGAVVLDLQNVKIGANAVSPDGRLLAYELKDEDNVNLADSRTGEILAQFPIVTGDGTGIQFNNSGTWLTVGSSNYIGGDGAVHVIDVASRAEIAVYDFKGFPWGAIFSPDDTFMTLMGESESLGAQIVELWNLESGEKVGTIEGITGATRTLYNADQSLLITGAGTSSASLIDTQTGTVLLVLDGQGSGATAYWYSPDETFIATGAGDGTMWLWGVVE